MNAKMPTPMANPRMPTSTQVRNPSRPPVASAPPTRPNRRRKAVPPAIANTNRNGSTWNRPGTPCAGERASGSGSGSPSMTRSMRSTPVAIPPAKSPRRNAGTMSSSMMRFAVASGKAPSRP